MAMATAVVVAAAACFVFSAEKVADSLHKHCT